MIEQTKPSEYQKEICRAKIEELLAFAISHRLLGRMDEIAARNALFDLLEINEYECSNDAVPDSETATDIMGIILDYAAEIKLIPENTITYRDMMDARIMGMLMPRQSEVTAGFYHTYERSPQDATSEFYSLCRSSNYIQVDRINKNQYWRTETEFGDMEITVNLSKPEKDPKEIAAARSLPQAGYPKCLLCLENIGYAGTLVHPARQNLRVIPMDLCGDEWYFQYSPYVYYNEHCIVLNKNHIPMKIDINTFKRLFAFVKILPHYFIGSNADLPIVGGSILTHDHFQGGRHVFPMEKAGCFKSYVHNEYKNVEISLVKWPMSVIRIAGKDTDELIELAVYILDTWRGYTDEEAGVNAFSGETPHNTITPIVRINKSGLFECDLVLRNNRTSDEHPLGIFHPHSDLHHIKKENIGLIEVMGLAVLPGRLENELKRISGYLTGANNDLSALGEQDDILHQHEPWITSMLSKYGNRNTQEKAEMLLRDEVGDIFVRVLRDAGVFKTDEKGMGAFERFMGLNGFVSK